MRVTAILASHNRRAHTLDCLDSYFAQEVGPGDSLSAVVVDDGSVDGTAHAVRERHPGAKVILGDGSLFWAGGMALAEEVAWVDEPDYLLWLNDDVVLDSDALSRLYKTSSGSPQAACCIAVGALRDPHTGELTYSGVRRRGFHPLRVELVRPSNVPMPVETFNGNVVLVPRQAASVVGPIDGAFVHGAADFDYGLRAVGVGVANILVPGTVGTCPRDHPLEPWRDRSRPPRERLALLLGPKGAPPRARARYLRRHGGPAWPVYWAAPYVRAALSFVSPGRIRRRDQ